MDMTIKNYATAYESKATLNVADLPEVSVDLVIEDDKFETDEGKEVEQKVIVLNEQRYRVPNSVFQQLKVILEDNPNLKKFKVKKAGEGMNTRYTVIPLV